MALGTRKMIDENNLDSSVAALVANASSATRASILANIGNGGAAGGSSSSVPGAVQSVHQLSDGSWPNPARAAGMGCRLYQGSTLPAVTHGATIGDLMLGAGGAYEMTASNVWTNLLTGATTSTAGASPSDSSTPAMNVRPFAQLGATGTWTATNNASVLSVLSDASSSTTATGVPPTSSGSVSLTMDMSTFAHVIGNDVVVNLENLSATTAGAVNVTLLGSGAQLGAVKTISVGTSASTVAAKWLASELPTRTSWADVEVKIERAGGNLVLSGLSVQSTTPVVTEVPTTVTTDQLKVAATSSWYQSVAAGSTSSASASQVAALVTAIGSGSVTLGGRSGVPVWIVPATTPKVSVTYTGTANATVMHNTTGTGVMDSVPVPGNAVASDNAYNSMAIWCPESNQLWEFVGMTKTSAGTWQASWGGRIDGLTSGAGAFTGLQGFTGSGLSAIVSAVKIGEVKAGIQQGRIDTIRHAVGIHLPGVAASISWPAIRSDGTSTASTALLMGQKLRLPSSFNVASSSLSPIGKMIAWAAQNYGLVVMGSDTPGSVLAESGEPERTTTGVNPWDAMLGTYTTANVLAGFPWSQLQTMAVDYGKDGNLTGGGAVTPPVNDVPAPTTGTAGAKATATLGTPRSGLPWHSGVWTGGPFTTARATGFGTWRGRQIDTCLAYCVYDSEASMLASEWNASLWNGTGARLVYGLAMMPINRDSSWTLANIASGAKDYVWTKIANDLISAGNGNAVIRIGWENNGEWYPWCVDFTNATVWKQAWRRIQSVLKAKSASFKFVWEIAISRNITGGSTRTAIFDLAYPGDDVVDIIGADFYNFYDTRATQESEWWQIAAPTSKPGLNDVAAFARARGKGMCFPEWGQHAVQGPGDVAFFINRAFQFFTENSDILVFEQYFNEADTYIANSLYDPNQMPNSATAYQTKWKAGAPTTTAVVNPVAQAAVMAYPTKEVGVYKMMFDVNPGPIANIGADFNAIILAFAQQTTGSLRLAGYSQEGKTSLVAGIKAKRAAGVRVLLGIGGGGYTIDVSNTTKFVQDVQWILADLGVQLDGIDWDVEHNLDPAKVVAISQALKSLYGANWATCFTVGGLDGTAATRNNRYDIGVALNSAGLLSRFAMQFYDWDTSNFDSAVKPYFEQMVTYGLPRDKLSFGMMLTTDTADPQHQTLTRASDQMTRAKAESSILKAVLWHQYLTGSATWATNMKTILGA